MKNAERSAAMIGMDVHRRFSKVTARNTEGKIVWRRRLDHADRDELRKRFRDWPARTPVLLESSFGWEWVCDELEQAGLAPHLVNAAKASGWRKVRGVAKTDRTDADLLSELWLQADRWWEVWLPPKDVRANRERMRCRMSLVRTQTALKNRIHAILHRHGILHDFSDLFGLEGRKMLTRLMHDETSREFPESARETLKVYMQLLDHLRLQIATMTRKIRARLVANAEGRRLKTLPGVGVVLGYTILAETGCFSRFRNGKHLASYSLLAPRAFDSGVEVGQDEPPKGRHVGRVGRRTLKWAWIEAARCAVRRGGRFRKILDRYTKGDDRRKNRGYIAVANRLCRIAYAMSKKEKDYSDDPPPRPGSSSKKAASNKTNARRSPKKKAPPRERQKRRAAAPPKSRPGTGRSNPGLVVAG